MIEIWKDIEGYEGLYQVSNLGRVKSLSNDQNRREKILKPGTNRGYLFVTLSKNNKRIMPKIHRLVASAFIPNDDPEHKIQVNHINENKADNRACNLNWMTPKENINWGTGVERKSKPVKQLTLDGVLVAIWPSVIETKKNGFNHSAVCQCCQGKRKTAYGYKWEYLN